MPQQPKKGDLIWVLGPIELVQTRGTPGWKTEMPRDGQPGLVLGVAMKYREHYRESFPTFWVLVDGEMRWVEQDDIATMPPDMPG
mgnify:CR=1 FL=1